MISDQEVNLNLFKSIRENVLINFIKYEGMNNVKINFIIIFIYFEFICDTFTSYLCSLVLGEETHT